MFILEGPHRKRAIDVQNHNWVTVYINSKTKKWRGVAHLLLEPKMKPSNPSNLGILSSGFSTHLNPLLFSFLKFHPMSMYLCLSPEEGPENHVAFLNTQLTSPPGILMCFNTVYPKLNPFSSFITCTLLRDQNSMLT